ncbi:MAG: hypothetical protein KF689_10080 [Gemmatimonadaceae bacterium]|nr:hypothetical protein [Gemmatimonadaceae bacterium]MCW5826052.1 hypothetical protein [Gemmatimonadaceae bacterium]
MRRAAVALTVFAAACGGEGGGVKTADIRIDPTPVLSIGVEEGDEPYQLHLVRDAIRLADGRVVVANTGSQELRIFDAAGRYTGALGRRGGGPMEFSEMSSMLLHPLGDGIVAADDGVFRVHHIGADLRYRTTRAFSLSTETPRPFLRAVAANGDLIATAFADGGRLTGQPGQVLPSSYHILRYDSLGTLRDTVLQLPSRPRFVNEHAGSVHFPYLPLSSETLWAVDGDRLVLVSPVAPVLEFRGFDGQVTGEEAWMRARVRTADVWEEYQRRALAQMRGADSARYAALYAKALPMPEYAPLYQGIKLDGARRIWLERFRMPGVTQQRWDVLSPEGKLLGEVATPEGVTVLRIGRDHLVGRARDSLGVERVQIFRVE